MSIGKDSIQKRVAKTTEAEAVVETPIEVVETKPAAKKSATKKAPAKKTTTKKAAPEATPAVGTTVLGNVSPEVVEKVTGHKENSTVEHIQIGAKMPTHLL